VRSDGVTLSGIGEQQGRSHPINDTWIASCCLAESLPLAPLNLQDYQDFVIHHGPAAVTE
jgi:predicted nucleic acid-binding protein